MDQISQFHFSKKAIQILLSLSLFSFLISYSSLFPFLLSTFSARQLCFFNDRNYIFLLCNGILAFLIKNSGLIQNSPPGSDVKGDNTKKNSKSYPSVSEISETKPVVTEVLMEIEKAPRRENDILLKQDERGDNVNSSTQDEGEEDQFLNIEEEEEEGIGLLSTEQLNKKCDDFIKKMREGIKTEAQQLIMVQCG